MTLPSWCLLSQPSTAASSPAVPAIPQLPLQDTVHVLPSREGDTWTPLRCWSSNPLSDTVLVVEQGQYLQGGDLIVYTLQCFP